MQDDYSDQSQKSGQIDLKSEHIIDTEDESSNSAFIETDLRNVMSEGEMDILTKWFPKTSKTLAGVLRNRPR